MTCIIYSSSTSFLSCICTKNVQIQHNISQRKVGIYSRWSRSICLDDLSVDDLYANDLPVDDLSVNYLSVCTTRETLQRSTSTTWFRVPYG